MVTVTLHTGETVCVDDEDAWVVNHVWYAIRTNGQIYAARNLEYKTLYMHRELMKTPAHLECHHKNSNGLDNRKENLENVTKSYNLSCREYGKGVSFHRRVGRYQAYVFRQGKQINLGYFDVKEEAIQAVEVFRQANPKVGWCK